MGQMNGKKALFIEAYIRSRCCVSEACKVVGIARQTFYKWLDKSPDFKRQVEQADEELIDRVEQVLYQKVDEMDTTAVIFFLKNRRPERWNEHRFKSQGDVNVVVNSEGPSSTIDAIARRYSELLSAGAPAASCADRGVDRAVAD